MNDINDLPADWAIERAMEMSGCIGPIQVDGGPISSLAIAFARYIESKEQPPVDPWLLQARELAAGVAGAISCYDCAEEYRDGGFDNDPEVQAIAAALRAAFEQGKAA